MKRAGFTMIELIFVIVILGILAAVALPKFAGVSDQANAQKCNAFTGTLNRTVGPSMWSQSITDGENGTVNRTKYTTVDFIATEDMPAECFAAASVAVAPTSTNVLPATKDANTSIGTPIFGTSNYKFFVKDGNISNSPRWTWSKQ